MYAMICIRQDLAHVVKWIFIYLKGITEYDIIFVRQKSDLSVIGYVDADYAGDLDDNVEVDKFRCIVTAIVSSI
jgi:hypothetical protein